MSFLFVVASLDKQSLDLSEFSLKDDGEKASSFSANLLGKLQY